MVVKLIVGVLFVSWLILVIMGKGGFVHLLLLSGIGHLTVELVTAYHARSVE